MPTIDVLIPTYNPNPEHLRSALTSLQAQTHTDWNAYIHDEPTDFDVREIESFLSDPRITYERGEKRLGIGANWNACFTATSAPVIAYLFQDDVWDEYYLERAVHALATFPDIGLISMNHHYDIEGDISTAEDYVELEEFRNTHVTAGPHDGAAYLEEWIRAGLRPNIIGEPDFVVLRRSLMETVGLFNESMPQALDAEYWVRCLCHTDWYFVKEHCGNFRVHSDAATAQNRKTGKGLFDRFQILQNFIDSQPSGPRRKMALAAQVDQFKEMVMKYTKKKERGERVSYGGGWIVKRFCLRHPIIVGNELLKMVLSQPECNRKHQ